MKTFKTLGIISMGLLGGTIAIPTAIALSNTPTELIQKQTTSKDINQNPSTIFNGNALMSYGVASGIGTGVYFGVQANLHFSLSEEQTTISSVSYPYSLPSKLSNFSITAYGYKNNSVDIYAQESFVFDTDTNLINNSWYSTAWINKLDSGYTSQMRAELC
jgi:hypothetical protein